MGMKLSISRSVLGAIRAEAARAAPLEACGLLFGSEGEITGCQSTDNVARTPERHFEIDPRALFAALRAERAGGPGIAGYWHSHPSGDATPSATDAAMAPPDGKVWLIVARSEVGAWRAGPGGFDALGLEVM
jgi:Predicted metal-dependent protease of the PAD1/JAB1 superfamily